MSFAPVPPQHGDQAAAVADLDRSSAVPGHSTLTDIEAEIAKGTWRLRFPQALETAFEDENLDQRIIMMIRTGLVALILYNLFLINDWLTLRDMFPIMLVARLGVFTPAIVAGLIILHRYRSHRVREITLVCASVLAVALPMSAMVFSDSTHALSYQYGSLMVMMFATVIQRLRFSYAVVGLGLMAGIQALTTYLSGDFDAETYATILMVFATAALLLAATSYYLEKAERRHFLQVKRGSLLRDELAKVARIDALTGLYNRRHLGDVTEAIWATSAAGPRVVSVILIDIDHFKLFNDTCGHLEGDVCLRRLSDCIAQVAQDCGGLPFRYGGEEMLVLLPDTEARVAGLAARAIHAAIRAADMPHPALGDGATVRASLGVASTVTTESGASALIAAADKALYAAKHAGRDQVWPPLGASPDPSAIIAPIATARPAA